MESSSLDGEDAGSNESLINDDDKGESVNIGKEERKDDSSSVGGEEESIKLLLDALDYTENVSEQKRKTKKKRHNDSYRQKSNTTSYDSVEASELGSENDLSQLNLVIPKINFCHRNASSSDNNPRSATMFDKRAIKLLKKHESESGKIFCGIIVILLLLGSCACLFVLGYLFHIEDLYIIAGILGAGGVLFTIAFIIVRCQTHDQIEKTDYSVLFKTSP